jgi:hypothetical protein
MLFLTARSGLVTIHFNGKLGEWRLFKEKAMQVTLWVMLLPLAIAAVALIVILLILFRRALLGILCTVGFIAGLALVVTGLSHGEPFHLKAEYPPLFQGQVLLGTVLPGAIIIAASLLALALGQRQQKKD